MMDRDAQLRLSQMRVGLLVIASLAALIFMIINLEEGMGLFVRHEKYHARVDNTLGLKVGGPVRMNGVDIGNVRKIGIADQMPMVELTFTIQRQLAPFIHEDAKVTIKALGLLGDKFLEIDPGTPSKPPLPAGGVLQSHIAETDIQNITSSAGLALENLNEAIREIHKVVMTLNEGQGTAGKILSDPTLYNRSSQVLDKLETATEKGIGLLTKVERGEGTIGQLISDRELYGRANAAVKELTELTTRLNTKDGTLTKLADPELYRRIQMLTNRGEELLAKVERGEGTAGKLITKDELYQRADKLLTEVETLVADVKKNPTKYFKFSVF